MHQSGCARVGEITTPHGIIHTPCFFFCATQGTLKGIATPLLKEHATPVLLANTYHLMLQPGADLVQNLGGLHKFMHWDGPIFTDSGGYQIFSLHHGSVAEEIKGKRRLGLGHKPVRITEEGALFTSHRDGSRHMLTPEKSIEVQYKLGADLICVLDECTPLHMSRQETHDSMERSHRWEIRSLEAFQKYDSPQGLYGIVQGGIYPDLRRQSAEFVASQPFFGHAIGGSLGASKTQMMEVVSMALDYEPLRHKPIHLLGIGGVADVFAGVALGIDTFDCVLPTRLGRHGGALVQAHYWDDAQENWHAREHINLWRACFREDPRPIDSQCPCVTCRSYSRAYLHHLLKAKEILALTALTIHNVCFMNRLMADIRHSIQHSDLHGARQRWLSEPTS